MDGDILGTRKRHDDSVQASNRTLGLTVGTRMIGDMPDAGTSMILPEPAVRRQTSGNILKRQRPGPFTGASLGAKAQDAGMTSGAGTDGSKGKRSRLGVVPVDTLSPAQLHRYQASVRSRFDRGCIRECILDRAAPSLLRSLEAGQSTGAIKETTTIAVASMAKLFVMDVVETARELRVGREGEEADGKPIPPSNLVEAHAQLMREGKLPKPRVAGAGARDGESNLLSGNTRIVKRDLT